MMAVAVSTLSSLDHGSSGVSSQEKVNAEATCKTARKFPFPKRKLPPVADYAGLCKLLIEETFPAASMHQTCLNAAMATGEPPDTFYRVIRGLTKSPDARLMMVVMAIRAQQTGKRQFDLGGGFAIRLIIGSEE